MSRRARPLAGVGAAVLVVAGLAAAVVSFTRPLASLAAWQRRALGSGASRAGARHAAATAGALPRRTGSDAALPARARRPGGSWGGRVAAGRPLPGHPRRPAGTRRERAAAGPADDGDDRRRRRAGSSRGGRRAGDRRRQLARRLGRPPRRAPSAAGGAAGARRRRSAARPGGGVDAPAANRREAAALAALRDPCSRCGPRLRPRRHRPPGGERTERPARRRPPRDSRAQLLDDRLQNLATPVDLLWGDADAWCRSPTPSGCSGLPASRLGPVEGLRARAAARVPRALLAALAALAAARRRPLRRGPRGDAGRRPRRTDAADAGAPALVGRRAGAAPHLSRARRARRPLRPRLARPRPRSRRPGGDPRRQPGRVPRGVLRRRQERDVLVPLGTRLTAHELAPILADWGARALFYGGDRRAVVRGCRRGSSDAGSRSMSRSRRRVGATPRAHPRSPAARENPVRARRPLLPALHLGHHRPPEGGDGPPPPGRLERLQHRLRLAAARGRRSPIFTPLYHAGGLRAFLGPLCRRRHGRPPRGFDPAEMWRTVEASAAPSCSACRRSGSC